MSRQWNQGSCEDELMQGMQQMQLKKVASEDNRPNQIVIEAMEELNAAAKCFERVGRTARAKEVTAVMLALGENSEEVEKKVKSPPKKKKTSGSEAKKVLMFFGFSPEDLAGLDLSSDGGDE
jgi:UDP-N-acetylmuramyl pentapeptide synthase